VLISASTNNTHRDHRQVSVKPSLQLCIKERVSLQLFLVLISACTDNTHRGHQQVSVKPGNLALEDEDPPKATISHYWGGPVQPTVPTGLSILVATHPDELKSFNVSTNNNRRGYLAYYTTTNFLASYATTDT
jgi:hypothetical protein